LLLLYGGKSMDILLIIHGLFRWVVVILGLAVLIKLALGIILKSKFTKLDRQLTMFFSIAMDIQVLLGLLNLVALNFPRQGMEHSFVMILAVVAVHLPNAWRKAPDNMRFRNTLISFVASLVLVFIGVALLGAWSRLA
jgi:hypothetical protein